METFGASNSHFHVGLQNELDTFPVAGHVLQTWCPRLLDVLLFFCSLELERTPSLCLLWRYRKGIQRKTSKSYLARLALGRESPITWVWQSLRGRLGVCPAGAQPGGAELELGCPVRSALGSIFDFSLVGPNLMLLVIRRLLAIWGQLLQKP